jgi:hypothetical protein
MPRPGVPLALGSLDQEHLDRFGAFSKHHRDGRIGVVQRDGWLRWARAKPLPKKVDLHADQLSGPGSTVRAPF